MSYVIVKLSDEEDFLIFYLFLKSCFPRELSSLTVKVLSTSK